MQIRIDNTEDLNKNSYLNAIADHIIASPGTPTAWGTSTSLPEDFGLAQAQSTTPYELDPDKVSRLNSQNNASLTHTQIAVAAKLDNLAFGVSVSPLMTISIAQTENHTAGSNTVFTFAASTVVNSKPQTQPCTPTFWQTTTSLTQPRAYQAALATLVLKFLA